MKKFISFSNRTITRFSLYYQLLLKPYEKEFISSKEIADQLGFTPEIIRKDLALLGQLGVPKKGYKVSILLEKISNVLGINKNWNVVIIGCGKLGSALMKYPGFKKHKFSIIAGFDISKKVVNKKINGIKIYHLNNLKNFAKKHKIDIAVITVPQEEAQTTINYVISCGIKGILNFTPAVVNPPYRSNVKILKIDLTIEFLRLACILNTLKKYDHTKK
ncbi:MAG: redox-sensing transcriptional repressor Rex [Elusimicrobiota bacterium]|nr:redox-sensing transcriptional repressor Rex [Endomicrobiia bacterium]MDW8165415.1 redox-sensing transcriptional repressor Rex [Elusimicrobiota bacterium]